MENFNDDYNINHHNIDHKHNFSLNLNTKSEFFVGNLNKTKTRDEIFKQLTSEIKIETLGGENLYIKRFNMPKWNARKDKDGILLLNCGYAFIKTKEPEMATELIKRKRMTLSDGTDIEFKTIDEAKRLKANADCKQKNYNKYNEVDVSRNSSRKNYNDDSDGINGNWRNNSSRNKYDDNDDDIFGNLRNNKNRKLDNSSDHYDNSFFRGNVGHIVFGESVFGNVLQNSNQTTNKTSNISWRNNVKPQYNSRPYYEAQNDLNNNNNSNDEESIFNPKNIKSSNQSSTNIYSLESLFDND
jgi:hypothetical protein